MGLDYETLENYGGFDAMISRTLAVDAKDFPDGTSTGSNTRDFAGILKQVLLDRTPISQTYLKVRPELCKEIEEGIAALGDRTEEVKEKLRALFPAKTAKE